MGIWHILAFHIDYTTVLLLKIQMLWSNNGIAISTEQNVLIENPIKLLKNQKSTRIKDFVELCHP